MKLLTVLLEDFRSYRGQQTFKLSDRGLVCILGDNRDEPQMDSNGCLSGDTLIDGPRDLCKFPKGIPLRSLVGQRPWVYAWQNGRIVIRRAERVWKTKKQARVVRVRLSKYATNRGAGQGGRYLPPQELVGTAEHLVLLSDRKTWKSLGQLVPGDSLCSMYRRESGGWRTLLYWTGSGTMCMGSRRGSRTVSEQQFVCKQAHGPRRRGTEVHHKNLNPYDHTPENLEWVRSGKHQGQHLAERNRLGLAGWRVSGCHPRGMKGKRHTQETKKRISRTLRKQRSKKSGGVNHTVLSVEDAGRCDVYDMRVPDADNFVANGVVVHNSGKSGIPQALDWCLFGVIPSGDHVDSVVHDEATGCFVEVSLEDGATKIKIQRRRSRGKGTDLKLFVNGVEKTTLDTKETQKLIEEVLGLDRQIFHAAVLFGQEDLLRFADATDSERMAILSKLLQLDVLDEWLETAKAKKKGVEAELYSTMTKKIKQEGVVESLKAQDVSAAEVKWEQSRVDQLAAFTRKIQAYDSRLHDIDLLIGTLSGVQEPQLPQTLVAFQQKVNQAQEKLAKSQTDLGGVLGRASQLRSAAKRQEEHMDHLRGSKEVPCSFCGQLVSEEHIESEVARIQREVADLYTEALDLDTQAQELKKTIQAGDDEKALLLRTFQEDQAQHFEAVSEAQAKISRRELAQKDRDWVMRSREAEARRYTELRGADNPWTLKKKALSQELAAAESKLADLTAKTRVQEEDTQYLEYWVQAFGPKGLKSYVIDARLAEMSDAANHWIRLLTGGTIWVRFETQTKGRTTGKLTNKLNIRVWRYNRNGTITERNYRSWSGGERQRISLGIDFGLASLLASRARKSYDLLLLDELFKHLDRKGREGVMSMLQALRREKSSIICIDHSEEFQAAFDHHVTVVKEHGASRIMEEPHAA